MTWMTPLVAPLSTSITLPPAALLLIEMKGLARCLVTVISSPAPVTTGLGPADRAEDRMRPEVMWRNRVASRAAGLASNSWVETSVGGLSSLLTYLQLQRREEVEGRVGRGEDGDGVRAGEPLHQAGRPDGRDEAGEGRVDCEGVEHRAGEAAGPGRDLELQAGRGGGPGR